MNSLSGAALAAILNSFWQAAAVTAAAWAALRFTPRMNAATRHLVWWAVLATIALLPFVPVAVRTPEPMRTVAPAVMETEEVAPVAAAATPAVAAPEAPIELPARGLPIWAFAIWTVVLLVQTARLGWSFLHLRSMKRHAHAPALELRENFDAWQLACGVHRPVRLLISGEVASPLAAGFRHPAVIVPEALLAQLQGAELDHVLLHELAHIARRDDWTNLAARVAAAIFGLHPAAAWILRQVDREREIACDDWVVAAIGAPRPYAQSLARLFELCFTSKREALAAGMAGRGSHLRERVELLLKPKHEFRASASMTRVAICSAALMGLVLIAAHAPRWIAFAQGARVAVPAAPAPAPVPVVTPVAPLPQPAPRVKVPVKVMRVVRPTVAVRPVVVMMAAQSPQPSSFLASLVAAGYGDLSVEDIIALKNNGISGEYLMAMSHSGWGKLAPADLIRLRQNGVSAEYARFVLDGGLRGATVNDVIELRVHGVDPKMLIEVHALGFGPFTAREAVDFASQGVRVELFRALKEAGFTKLQPREIIEAQQSGLRADNLREARQYGSSLSLQQILKLKRAGVI